MRFLKFLFVPADTSADSNLKYLTGYGKEEWEKALDQTLENNDNMTLKEFYTLIIAKLQWLNNEK